MRRGSQRVGLRRDQAVEVRGELMARDEGGDEPLPPLSLTGKSAFGPSRHAPEMSTFGLGLDVTQGDQLMQVKKIDTVKADADAQFEVDECFRLRRLRHDGSKNS